MKYICIGPMQYRIFDNHETHVEVAREVGLPVLSAGFIRFDEKGQPIAYGDSVSLGIPSNPTVDTPMLQLIWRNS